MRIRVLHSTALCGWALGGLVAGGGCYAEPLDPGEFDLPVLAVLENDELRLQSGDAELDGDPNPPAQKDLPYPDHVLSYELANERGEIVRSGVVPDPRHVHSEWDEGGEEMSGMSDMGEEGAAGLWLPQRGGELRVYRDFKTDGEPLASTEYAPGTGTPEGIDQLSQGLVSSSDLRHTPQRLWGSAARDEAINILFLPEGFQASEMDEFRSAALSMMEDMFAEKPTFERFEHRFNAWYMEIPSADSGVSLPAEGVDRTTAFEVAVDDRNIAKPSTLGRGAAGYLRMRRGMDVAVLVANADRHRGVRIGNVIVVPNKPGRAATLAHELGHALVGLADEYTESSACTFVRRLRNRQRPNIDNTSNRDRLKWSHLIDSSTPIPTDGSSSHGGDVGAFEGAGYCEDGWYRPQHTCLMRSSGKTMCDVCRAELEAVMQDL